MEFVPDADARPVLPLSPVPTIEATFSPSDAPQAAFVEVGQLSEYVPFNFTLFVFPGCNGSPWGPKRCPSAVTNVKNAPPPRWRDKSNVFRTQWGISNIPAIVRFEQVDGRVAETGRLTEGGILDEQKLRALLGRA